MYVHVCMYVCVVHIVVCGVCAFGDGVLCMLWCVVYVHLVMVCCVRVCVVYVVVCGVCAFGDGVLCTYVCVVYVVVCGVHTYMCVLCRMVENPVIQNIKYSEKWLSKSVLHEHMIPYTSLQCL